MNRPRTPLAGLLIAAVLMAATAGCGSEKEADVAVAKPAKSPEGVKLRVGVQKDGIRAILEKSGQLKDVPYEISFSTFAFGPPLVEAAGADKIDVAGVGSTPPIFGAAADSDFRAIATLQYRNDSDDAVLVPKGSDITKPEQLKGKTVAVAKGSSAHGLLLTLLTGSGSSPTTSRSRSSRRPTRWPRSRPAASTPGPPGIPTSSRPRPTARSRSRAVRPTSTVTRSRSPPRRRSRTPSAPPRSRTTSRGCRRRSRGRPSIPTSGRRRGRRSRSCRSRSPRRPSGRSSSTSSRSTTRRSRTSRSWPTA